MIGYAIQKGNRVYVYDDKNNEYEQERRTSRFFIDFLCGEERSSGSGI